MDLGAEPTGIASRSEPIAPAILRSSRSALEDTADVLLRRTTHRWQADPATTILVGVHARL